MVELGILVRHFPAPKTHPQSVGLSERYVQLITFSLRRFLDQHPSAIGTWDVFLSSIVHALNCRTVKIVWDLNPEDKTHIDELEVYIQNVTSGSYPLPSESISDPELRVATPDEIRQTAPDRLFKANKSITRQDARKRRWEEPKEGDLVLLRRFGADQHHDRKLEPRWEGPYRLADVAFHGRSGRLEDLHSGKIVKVRASG